MNFALVSGHQAATWRGASAAQLPIIRRYVQFCPGGSLSGSCFYVFRGPLDYRNDELDFLGWPSSGLHGEYRRQSMLEFIARYRTWKAARQLAGTWVAYSMRGRMVEDTPMPGAGLTVVSARGNWWSSDSAVLDVRSQDIDISNGETRDHDGHIVFDPAIPWLATRIDRYADSSEVAEQRLVIGPDYNIVYVFPVAAVSTLGDVYGKHAWRRKDA